MIRESMCWSAAAVLLGSLCNPAVGADLGGAPTYLEPRRPIDQWVVQVTPYGWLPWIQGNVEIKRRTTGIDIDPIQVLDHLERMPWMSYIEARRGPLSFYNDVFYANIGVSGSGIKARDFGRIGASASLDFEEVVAEFGATYQIMRLTPHTAVDVLVGARYWHQDMSVAVDVAGG